MRTFVVQALREQVDDDLDIANVDDHVVAQDDDSRWQHFHRVGHLGTQVLEPHLVVALRVYLLEDTEADAQVLDVVAFGVYHIALRFLRGRSKLLATDACVIPDLEVSALMLLGQVAIAWRDDEVVDNIELLFLGRWTLLTI